MDPVLVQPGKLQNLRYDRICFLYLALDHCDRLVKLFFILYVLSGVLALRHDDGDRRLQFMTHIRGKLLLPLKHLLQPVKHPVVGLRQYLDLLKCAIVLNPLGQILFQSDLLGSLADLLDRLHDVPGKDGRQNRGYHDDRPRTDIGGIFQRPVSAGKLCPVHHAAHIGDHLLPPRLISLDDGAVIDQIMHLPAVYLPDDLHHRS